MISNENNHASCIRKQLELCIACVKMCGVQLDRRHFFLDILRYRATQQQNDDTGFSDTLGKYLRPVCVTRPRYMCQMMARSCTSTSSDQSGERRARASTALDSPNPEHAAVKHGRTCAPLLRRFSACNVAAVVPDCCKARETVWAARSCANFRCAELQV